MNGNELVERQYEQKIDNIIGKNPQYKFLRGYVNSLISRRSTTTVCTYLTSVVKFLNDSGVDPSELKYDDYINYMASISKKTSSYQILVYSALKKLSSYLNAAEINSRDPMKNIERPKAVEGIKTKKKRENGYLTPEEIEEYLNNIKNSIGDGRASADRANWYERDLAIAVLLLTTGMRCSALYKLNVENINLKNGKLITVDKEQRVEEHYLSSYTCFVLKEWLERRDEYLRKNNISNESALFISRKKNRLSTWAIEAIINKYAITINGKHITPHKLRATYGTQLYNKTHDLYLVQKCMGHGSPKTSALYIRGIENDTRMKASEIMDEIIAN